MGLFFIFAVTILFTQQGEAAQWKITCKNGDIVYSADACKGKGGVKSAEAIPVCGDGIVDAGEVCDHGPNNSDSAKNACRTDCRFAYCGDGVIDSNEQCDDGGSNSDTTANTCRKNCRLPICGDGIVDDGSHYATNTAFNEACDDGNPTNSDGCMTNCRTCLQLGMEGNIDITSDTYLCPAQYVMDDYGDYGAIIIKASGVTLDCQGAILVGEGRGVGVLNFRSNDVTIKDCTIRGYDVGVRIQDAKDVDIADNWICSNLQRDVELIDATNVKGYQQSMALPSKCATAQVQSQASNLAKITVPRPSGSSAGKTSVQASQVANKNTKKVVSRPSQPVKVGPTKKVATASVQTPQKSLSPKPSHHYLLSQAGRANWSSRSGRVVYGTDRLPKIGQARAIASGQLADGRRVNNLLLAQPDWQNRGFIQGVFPTFKPGKTAKFTCNVGMLRGAGAQDSVSFDLIVQDGKKSRVIKSQRLSGKERYVFNADLSKWHGKNIQVILRTRHLKGKPGLPAVWINPSLFY